MEEFNEIVSDIISNEKVLKMKNFNQHFDFSCFDHCYNVAYFCYKVCKKMKLDYVSAARAAMLHDFFLYDWRVKNNYKGLHAFNHGKIALNNALEIFELNKMEQDMIKNHMWPVTLKIPSSLEGIILTFADKYMATKESLSYLYRWLCKRETVKYAGLLIQIIIMNIRYYI